MFFFGIDVLNIYHTESLEMGRQVKFKINATKRALPYTSDKRALPYTILFNANSVLISMLR